MVWSRIKIAGLAFFAAFVVLQSGMWDSPDVELYGAAVPAWLMGLVFYVLGVGAGWAAERSRSGRG